MLCHTLKIYHLASELHFSIGFDNEGMIKTWRKDELWNSTKRVIKKTFKGLKEKKGQKTEEI